MSRRKAAFAFHTRHPLSQHVCVCKVYMWKYNRWAIHWCYFYYFMRLLNSLVVLLEALFENRQATFWVFFNTHARICFYSVFICFRGVKWALGVVHCSFGGIIGGHTWQFDRSWLQVFRGCRQSWPHVNSAAQRTQRTYTIHTQENTTHRHTYTMHTPTQTHKHKAIIGCASACCWNHRSRYAANDVSCIKNLPKPWSRPGCFHPGIVSNVRTPRGPKEGHFHMPWIFFLI